jgi:epsilon-lactone hydrolase
VAWSALTARYAPGRCAVAGDSAGGGLGFAMLAQARAVGLPMPGCLVGLSPWVNFGTENTSYDRLAAVDPMLSREVVEYFVSRYAPTINRRDARISPLYAALDGLPPTLIQIGDHECFFGDATLMHEALIAAGVDSELTVEKQMFHVWQLHWPMLDDGRTALAQAGRFISQHCSW